MHCRRTERNEPAREFIQRLGATSNALALEAATLAGLRYEPEDQTESTTAKGDATNRRCGFGRTNLSAAMQRLGDELGTIEAVVAAMESSRHQAQPLTGQEPVEDASALERSLSAIWKKALGRTRIGITENFFDAGGTSLKAVVVVAMIRKELKRNLSIITLFECPTIKLLAAKLVGSADAVSAAATSAESRGRQRRHHLVKRRTA